MEEIGSRVSKNLRKTLQLTQEELVSLITGNIPILFVYENLTDYNGAFFQDSESFRRTMTLKRKDVTFFFLNFFLVLSLMTYQNVE